MSYDPRLAASRYGAPATDNGPVQKGSVRAARERLMAATGQRQQPIDRSKIIGLPQRPNQPAPPLTRPSPPQPPQDISTPPDSRDENTSLPQWPLPNTFPSPNRGPPPQRPPRPVSDDELPIQQPSPGYRESFESEDPFSPISNPSRPLTTSSAASESSSLGEIPDFPVPQPPMPVMQAPPRRTPSLGPPPSSRRGPSSYYTQMSYVSPIAEESETRSNTIRSHHGSFASSNVMPYNDDYYIDDYQSEDEETVMSDRERDSMASLPDDNGEIMTPALLRQASLGRRTKPSLMTIKSVDSFGQRKPQSDMSGAAGIGSTVLAAKDGLGGAEDVFSDPSPSDDSSIRDRDFNSRYNDPEKETMGMEAAGRNRPRPPRLNMEAVREAEARGSLTSLPDLIRRATRLAANLDRGKTASRLSFAFWESGAPPKNSHRSGSMTDMLAAFPPPGAATPSAPITPIAANANADVNANTKRISKWPSTGGYDGAESAMTEPNEKKRRRRCCGMPCWTFITLLIVLLFLVAAAVVIPVVLVVLPKMNSTGTAAQDNQGPTPTNGGNNGGNNNNNNNNNNPASSAPSATLAPQSGTCSGIITCQNGGVAILNADRTCNCVCINGFTGSTCATAGDAGCTTTTIAGTANNATVGSGIPRLITSAQTQFSVPLNATRLLSIFSSLSLSCTAENALITFNGLASRSYVPILVETSSVTPTRSLPLLDSPHPEHDGSAPRFLEERQAIGAPGTANASPTSSQPAAATASTASGAKKNIIQPVSSNATALDFARVSVLLALQQSGKLDDAANGQEAIQDFLTQNRAGNSRGNTVTVGQLTVDLVQLSIKFQNGTTITAKPS